MITYGDQVLKIEEYAIRHDYYGRDTLSFYIPPGHEQYGDIKPLMSLHCRDDNHLYIVRKMDSGDVVAELDLSDLQAQMYVPYRSGEASGAEIIRSAIPENWQVIDQTGMATQKTVELDSATPLEIIEAVCEQFAIAVRYDNVGKYITLVNPEAYTATSAYFTDELNLKSLATTVTTDNYATRLYAYGAEGLSFADINGGKAYVDAPDLQPGTPVISAYWQEDVYTDAAQLLEAARKRVAELAVPVASYELSVIDLAKTRPEEYGELEVHLYDKVPLLDRQSGQRTVHQVVEYTEYPNFPDRNELVLSTQPQRIQRTVARLSNTVDSVTRPDGSLVANKIAGFINGANASLRAQYDVAEKQDVLAILFENLDETSEMFGALAIGTQGILISKQRTADSKDWVWTTAINYAGVIADTIVSGLISSKDGRVYIDLDKGESSATKLIGESLIGDREVEAVIGQKRDDPNACEGVVLNIDGETKIALNYPIEGLESLLPVGLYVTTPMGNPGMIQFKDDLISILPPRSAEDSDRKTEFGGSIKVAGNMDITPGGCIKSTLWPLPSDMLFPVEIKGGLKVEGDLDVENGSKNRVVNTSQGKVRIAAYETAEPYFGDIGEAQTDENGQARIDIDPLFAETVNTSCPYQVFLQPYCNGVFYVAERAEDHFIVKGPKNGMFGYEIKARQKGYEASRLENNFDSRNPIPGSTEDGDAT